MKGFQRVHLNRGEKKTVSFTLTNRDLSIVDPDGKHRVVAGTVQAWLGGGQPGKRSGGSETLGIQTQFAITGDVTLPD